MVRTTIRVLSYSTTATQEKKRSCSEKTKVYNGTARKRVKCIRRNSPLQQANFFEREVTGGGDHKRLT
ncbi:hypothetical protein TNCV_4771821 [Trichonephila clavipes]|nr:hypothetical protein TNCV_4771821 [Trichonephila clavipes]